MDLHSFYEREQLKNMLAHTMEFVFQMEPRDEILDAAADRMLMLVQDVFDILRKKEKLDGTKEEQAMSLFDTLMQAIMMQDILIALQEEQLDKLRGQ